MITLAQWTTLHHLNITPHTFDQSTHTAAQAATQLGCDIGQIAKSIVFKTPEGFVLAIGRGGQQIDLPHPKASAQEVLSATGYQIGGVPPFALPQPFFDPKLLDYPIVYASAGTANSVFAIAPKKLLEFTQAQLI